MCSDSANTPTRGFTLIELLIVVAIIAILAAIAVPNFLEAQTRAKISRVYSDFRTLRTGMETYRLDCSEYPTDWTNADYKTWSQLTTPVAYVMAVIYTPWVSRNMPHNEFNADQDVYDYGGPPYDVGKAGGILYWVLCPGPDQDHDFMWSGNPAPVDVDRMKSNGLNVVYDTTNGTKSSGDILFSNKRIYYL